MTKQIQETRCTCQSCGNNWHYGKSEAIQNAANAMGNVGKDMTCCSGCFTPAGLMKNKPVANLNQCPKCGSRAVKKEIITHTV